MSSCMASSFSHGDAFISSKPERTITLTSSPPSRRDERQQSIAVLPPPSTMTRLPMRSIWPKETLESQSMPIWIFLAASLRPGISRSRPRGAADKDRVIILGKERFEAVNALAADELDAEVEDVLAFLVEHSFRQAEFRNLRAHHTAGLRVLIENDAVIAQRREVARHRQRGRAATDERNALTVLLCRRLRQPGSDIVLEIGGDALQSADRHRLLLHPATTAGRFAGPVARAPEDPREH